MSTRKRVALSVVCLFADPTALLFFPTTTSSAQAPTGALPAATPRPPPPLNLLSSPQRRCLPPVGIHQQRQRLRLASAWVCYADPRCLLRSPALLDANPGPRVLRRKCHSICYDTRRRKPCHSVAQTVTYSHKVNVCRLGVHKTSPGNCNQ